MQRLFGFVLWVFIVAVRGGPSCSGTAGDYSYDLTPLSGAQFSLDDADGKFKYNITLCIDSLNCVGVSSGYCQTDNVNANLQYSIGFLFHSHTLSIS
jgi:hypothetical protein